MNLLKGIHMTMQDVIIELKELRAVRQELAAHATKMKVYESALERLQQELANIRESRKKKAPAQQP